MPMKAESIEIENVLRPGKTYRANREKYEAMREALVGVLPRSVPGFSVEEMIAAVKPRLPDALFPGGETAGWWVKAVQLDLEAKGLVRREGKPLRFRLAA
jgi:hypothetical protein